MVEFPSRGLNQWFPSLRHIGQPPSSLGTNIFHTMHIMQLIKWEASDDWKAEHIHKSGTRWHSGIWGRVQYSLKYLPFLGWFVLRHRLLGHRLQLLAGISGTSLRSFGIQGQPVAVFSSDFTSIKPPQTSVKSLHKVLQGKVSSDSSWSWILVYSTEPNTGMLWMGAFKITQLQKFSCQHN